MSKFQNINQLTGQSSTSIDDQLYDNSMDSSAEHKRHDDELLEAYLEYEKYMNQQNDYRSAA